MRFSYTPTAATNTKARLIKRPLLELELIGRGQSLKAFALIDSGADITMMNLEYAHELGLSLDESKTKDFVGISSERIRCYLSWVTYRVKGFSSRLTTPVAFIDSASVDILLGQEDFFEYFRVTFDKSRDVFDMELSEKASSLG